MAESSTLSAKIESNLAARGLAIIITNDYTDPQPKLEADEDRLSPLEGPQKDGKSMSDAFDHLGFVVYWEHNITSTELTRLIRKATDFQGYSKLKQYTCIAFVFSGHGKLGDLICLQDGSKMSINDEIISLFLPKCSPNMGHLQKLFFFDACRGEEEMKNVAVARGKSNDPVEAKGTKKIHVPEEGGFLAAFSTVSNYVSWEMGKGGVWLQRLADKIKDSRESIDNILTQVNAELISAGLSKTQQPEKISRLNSIVYLHRCPDKKQDINYDDCPHYQELVSQYPSHSFSDYPYIPPNLELKVTYYRSTVTVKASNPHHSIIGDSGKFFISIKLSRENAAKNALLKLKESNTVIPPSESVPVHSKPQDDRSGADSYLQQMNIFFNKEYVRPQFEFQSDGPTRHRCIVRYTLNGQQKKVDSGHFYLSKFEAKEQVAKRVLSRENVQQQQN